jgi:cell division protein FtsB
MDQKRAELLLRLEKLKKEVQTLEERNAQLKVGVSQVTQDEYWEEKIREQGYKKPGEEVVVVKPEVKEEEKEEKEQSFWDKLLRKFGF